MPTRSLLELILTTQLRSFESPTVSNAADGLIVTWQSVADKTYTIEFSTTMNGDWINVVDTKQVPVLKRASPTPMRDD